MKPLVHWAVVLAWWVDILHSKNTQRMWWLTQPEYVNRGLDTSAAVANSTPSSCSTLIMTNIITNTLWKLARQKTRKLNVYCYDRNLLAKINNITDTQEYKITDLSQLLVFHFRGKISGLLQFEKSLYRFLGLTTIIFFVWYVPGHSLSIKSITRHSVPSSVLCKFLVHFLLIFPSHSLYHHFLLNHPSTNNF